MVKIEKDAARLPAATGAARGMHPLEAAAHHIVAGGAIMTVPQTPVARRLVGTLSWLEPQRVFWFTAYGDTRADGQLMEIDEARPVAGGIGIQFLNNGRVVGCLMPIEHAGVDDPDDYRIAWQLWQEVAPLRTAMIERCAAELAAQQDALPGVPPCPAPVLPAHVFRR